MGSDVGQTSELGEDRFGIRLGSIALSQGMITPDQLREALSDQEGEVAGGNEVPPLGFFLVAKGFITEEQLEAALEEQKRQAVDSSRSRMTPGGHLAPLKAGRQASPAGTAMLGKYQLSKELGRGAMGIVYEALDTHLNRRVALKVLVGSRHPDPKEALEEQQRFMREAHLSANLPKHPNIVSVYEAGVAEGNLYLTAELIQGKSMDQWRKTSSVTLSKEIALLREVALAIHHAHEHNIVHRDLKPQNVLVDGKGHACVTDFGLAKTVGENVGLSLTAAGLVVGTPGYMSPEQAQGLKSLDRRTDVWSLGIMLYEALAGQLPFTGETAVEILMRIVKKPVPSLATAAKTGGKPPPDKSLERICLKALAKKPRDRFLTAEAFAQDLGRWLKGETVRAKVATSTARRLRPPRKSYAWAYGIAAAVGLILILVLFSSSSGPPPVGHELARAERHMREGDYTEAQIAYAQALAKDPGNRRALAGRKKAREAVDRARREADERARASAAADVESERNRAKDRRDLEKRVREAEEATRKAKEQLRISKPAGLAIRRGDEIWEGAVNLLYLVDPKRDAVFGTWAWQGGKLVSDGSPRARIEVPYRPPEEYDLRVGFTRREGVNSVNLILPAFGRSFVWKMGGSDNSVFAFDSLRGARFDANSTTVRAEPALHNGRAYTSIVKVRKDGVEAYLDGNLICQWKGGYPSLSIPPDWKLRDGSLLGLGTWECPTAFHRLELREVTGNGRRARVGPSASDHPRRNVFKAVSVDPRSLRPGLIGRYYLGKDFDAPVFRRIDSRIAFDWAQGRAWPGGPTDFLSIAWSGYLQVPRTGRYTFRTVSDDGVRLIIDGVPVQRDWTSHPRKENWCTRTLEKGFHRLNLEYFDEGEYAVVSLSWKGEFGGKLHPIWPKFLFHDPTDFVVSSWALKTLWKAILDGKQRLLEKSVPLAKPGMAEGRATIKDVTQADLRVVLQVEGGGTFENTEKREDLPSKTLLELLLLATPKPSPRVVQAMAITLAGDGDVARAFKELDRARASGVAVQKAARVIIGQELTRLESLGGPVEKAAALKRLLISRDAYLTGYLKQSLKERIAALQKASSRAGLFRGTGGTGTADSKGLAGYWKFDEGRGGNARDSSGNDLHGILKNGAAWTRGYSGSALRFDGIDDYLDLGRQLDTLRNVREATFMFRVNMDPGFKNSAVICFSVGSSRGTTSLSRVQLDVFSNGAVRATARASDRDPGEIVDTAAGEIVAGTWTHLAVVIQYDRKSIRIYKDGSEIAAGRPTFSRSATADTDSSTAAMGSQDDGSGLFYKGKLDEVRLYRRALSAPEIAALTGRDGRKRR